MKSIKLLKLFMGLILLFHVTLAVKIYPELSNYTNILHLKIVGDASDKESTSQCRRQKRYGFSRRGQEDPSILSWRIPWTEEPGEL